MFNFFSLLLPSWYLYHIIEYGLHKLSHSRTYGGYIYRIHMNHHRKYYPLKNFTDYEPYQTGQIMGLPDGFVAFSLPGIFISLGFYQTVEYDTFMIMFPQVIMYFIISDYFHTQYHTKGSWLEKYEWFLYLRNNHRIHHKTYIKNLNMIDPTIDKLNHSFKNK